MMQKQTLYPILALLLSNTTSILAQTAVPQAIQPPPGSALKLQTQARGEQIYQCVLSGGQYQWLLKGPDAVLLDMQGRQIGRHLAGPVWQLQDGSRITGKLMQKLDVPLHNAIPWLLLETVQYKGVGLLYDIRYINRIDTHGGMPPAKSCDGNRLGEEKRSPYQAKYYFYTSN